MLLTPKDADNQLLNLFHSGKFNEAERVALGNIQESPEHLLSWKLLGVIYLQKGLFKKSLKFNKKIIEINPSDAEGYCYLGSSYKLLGQSSKAIKYFKKATELKENYSDALLNLAAAQAETKQFDDAALNFQKFIALNPENSDALFQLGVIMDQLEKYEEATEAYLKAYNLNHKNPELFLLVATSLMRCKEYEPSLKFFKLYNLHYSKNWRSFYNMGIIYKISEERLDLAIENLKKSIELNPNHVKAYIKLAEIYVQNNDIDDAEKLYLDATRINPNEFGAYVGLSEISYKRGEKDRSIKYLEKMKELDESHPLTIIRALKINKSSTQDLDFKKAYDLFQKGSLTNKHKMSLCFRMAETYERSKDFKKAFEFYDRGNEMARVVNPYDREDDILRFKKHKEIYRFIEDFKSKATPDLNQQIPIFILGMPRSGTSLLEQIISSHNEVYGAGELGFLSSCFETFLNSSKELKHENLLRFRECYFENIRQLSGKRFVTDKMPHNFLLIGFIVHAIPEAKIIYSSRDPGAVCWGNFKQNFQQIKSLLYSSNLEDIVHFYKLHNDLMDFWIKKFPRKIIQCKYESLTSNPESEIRRLLDKLELDWDENCLSPEKNSRTVFTASNQQVKQKIYSNSSRKWEKFRPYIGNLFDELY